jgi:hypothetical protein
MHAMHTTVATTPGSAQGSLAFARDMFLNVPLIADWQAIARLHKHHVNENLICANREQCQYDYAPVNPTKLGVTTEGPYIIEHVHVNGNLTILLHDGITEHIKLAECCRIVKTFPLTPVKTVCTDELYLRSFRVYYLMSFFLRLIT